MHTPRPASALEGPLPLLYIAVSTVFAVGISILSLLSGWLTIFQNLFYIPIILACIFYTKRGFLFSLLLSGLYLAMMLASSSDPVVIEGALIRVVIFILVAAVITVIASGRLKAEAALRESESRYSALFDNNYSTSLLIDPDTGRIVEANEAACLYYGYPHKEMLSKTISDLNRLPLEKVVGDLQRAKRAGKKHFFSTHYLAGGERRDVEVYSGPITVQGKPLFYSIIHDVTERKQAEEALRESEKRYRDFFMTSRDSVFITTPTGHWIDFNETALEMFGYGSREELMDLPLPALYERAEDRERLTRLIETNNYVREYPVRLRRKDGSVIDTLITSVPLRRKDGSTEAYLGSIRDITERKQAEKDIQGRERFLHQLIETITNPIFYKDKNGLYAGCNTAFAAFIGLPPEQVIGRSVYDLSPRDLADIYDAQDRQLLERPGTQVYEAPVRYADGSRHDVIFNKATLVDGSGKIEGLVGVMIDITERKRAEEALILANRKLNLLGSVTRHDILNQLLVVNGYLELLAEKIPDPSLEMYFTRVTNATARIEAIIRFTKAYEEVGVHAPVWQEARTVVDTAAKDAIAGEVRLKNELPAGVCVFADPLIVKVFYNLIDNAMRHNAKVTTVRFSGGEHEGGYRITCEDDGGGVPAGEKEKIFERGYGKNTGFGLFLAREILSITGIAIAETGEPGKGARFEIIVPKGGYRVTGGGGPV